MTEGAVANIEQKIGTYEENRREWCRLVVKSNMVPKSLNTPEKVFIAVEAGMEAGLSPLQALSSVYVVNGMPAWTGQGAMALIRGSGACSIPPTIAFGGEDDHYRCTITFQRKDMPRPVEVSFSVAEAKRAKLWGKSGPWAEHPDDMLMWRAVGRMARFYFSDILKGHAIVEAAQDRPAVRVTVEPEQPTTPDPLLSGQSQAVKMLPPEAPPPEIDPETGEVIPDWVGKEEDEEQGELL